MRDSSGKKQIKQVAKASRVKMMNLDRNDREGIKGIVAAWLNLNIAYKKFSLKKINDSGDTSAEADTLREMCVSSIDNSNIALKNIEKIENVEVMNSGLARIPQDDVRLVTAICSLISGTYADFSSLDTDRAITALKSKELSKSSSIN